MFLFFIACQSLEKTPGFKVTLSPSNPTSQDTLVLELTSSDSIDLSTPNIQWFQNGEPFTNLNISLDATNTKKEDEWYASVMIETEAANVTRSSNLVLIENSPPNPPTVMVEPSEATAGIDPLECSASAEDYDNDDLIYSYYWTNDGTDVGVTEQVILAEETIVGSWRCHVEVSDGTATSSGESNNVEVGIQNGALISNGDFELGDLSGWNIEGACEVIDILDYLQPAQGDWFAYAGSEEDCTLSQTIILKNHGYTDEEIDAKTWKVELSSILANFDVPDDFDDQVSGIVIFQDAFENEIGRIETLIAGDGQWIFREAERLIPPETRILQLQIKGELRMDNINHSHVDDVQIQISQAVERQAVFTKYPMLQDYRTDAMTIIWETDSADHVPSVEYGLSGLIDQKHTLIRSIWVNDEHVVHVAEITDLEIDTQYDYRVCADSQCTDTATFQTAPDENAPIRIAWMADNQEGDHRFRTHLTNLDALEPDLLFVAGDMLQYGDELHEWNTKWWDPLQTNQFAQSVPTMIARGNHDREHPFAYAYTHMPGNGAWYKFHYGSVFVVVLNTHAPVQNQNPIRDQLVFLTQALASPEAQAAEFRIVTFHQAPYTNATQHNTTGCEACRDDWVPVFEQYGVDLVISGHFHSYQRGEQNGVTYVIVAGGGSALLADTFDNWSFMTVQQTWMYSVMDVVDGQLVWETYNLDNELIDAFHFNAR